MEVDPPLPAATALWGRSTDDLWAVGADGALLHWDGARWSLEPSGTTRDLKAIHGSAAGDVRLAGDGIILRRNGDGWSRDPADTEEFNANDVWSFGPDDLWVAAGVVAAHWNGSAWTRTMDPPGTPVWALGGISPEDLWAVGSWGAIARWDGTAWADLDRRVGDGELTDVWGASADDVWAVGEDGVIHWDGL